MAIDVVQPYAPTTALAGGVVDGKAIVVAPYSSTDLEVTVFDPRRSLSGLAALPYQRDMARPCGRSVTPTSCGVLMRAGTRVCRCGPCGQTWAGDSGGQVAGGSDGSWRACGWAGDSVDSRSGVSDMEAADGYSGIA